MQGNGQFYFVILLLFVLSELDNFSQSGGFQGCRGCRKLIEMQIWVKIHQGSWCCTRKTEDKESKTENRMVLECQPGCEGHGLYPSGLQLHQGLNPNSPTSPDSALTKYSRCLPLLLLK